MVKLHPLFSFKSSISPNGHIEASILLKCEWDKSCNRKGCMHPSSVSSSRYERYGTSWLFSQPICRQLKEDTKLGVAQALPALRHTQILSSASSTWESQHPLAKKMAKTVGLEVRRQDVCSSQSPAPGKQGTWCSPPLSSAQGWESAKASHMFDTCMGHHHD